MDSSSLADDLRPPFTQQSTKGFTPYYYAWRLCGLWPMPDDWNLYKVYSVFAQLNYLVLFNLLILLSLSTAKTLDDVMEVLMPVTTTVIICFKGKLIVYKRKALMALLATAIEMEEMSKQNPEEQAVLEKSNRQARKLQIIMAVCCLSSIAGRFVQSLVSDQRKLMWKSLMPLDWEYATSDWPYIAAIGFQVICNYYIGVLYSTIDPLAPYLYRMFVGNIEILSNRLRTLGQDEVDSKAKLISCVKYHLLCLRYNQCLYEIFSISYLVQFIFSGVVICITVYELSVIPPTETMKFTFLIAYLINMCLQLFIPCYFGSLVCAQSERLGNALFQSNWSGQPLRFQAQIKIFLSGVQRPIVLDTFKGLFAIALPTFVTVCRAAYSLLSCLKGAVDT